jgi:hypothetical protein
MKRFFAASFLALLSISASASKSDADYPLVVHITAVHMEQGQEGVSGSGSTDSNGNYTSSVGGGGSYTWKLYTTQIQADPKIYELSTPRRHYRGGEGVAAATVIATMGWGALFATSANYSLNIGDYQGRWNKNGTLEIQFNDPKGKLTHQTFSIQAEDVAPTPTPAPPVPAPPSAGTSPQTATAASLTLDSSVAGADIEIDGAFVGNTPSTVSVAQGNHLIAVKKKGFTVWTRTLNVTGGSVHLNAELDPAPAQQ